MNGRLAGRLWLRLSSCSPSLVQVPGIKNCIGPASALQCSGISDDASSPSSHLLFHRSLGWLYLLQVLPTCSASKSLNYHHYIPSSGLHSSNLYSRYTSAQSCATPSNASTLRIRSAAGVATRKDRRCWSCEHETSTGNGLFCPSCKAIQPLDSSVDFFQIFSIDKSFKVDLKVLEQSYKDLQKKLHPDLAGLKSQSEQGYSAEQSAHVIQAYYILLRPLSRARYLLELHNIKVEEEGTIDDPELLMEIMELRESIEDVSDAELLKNAQADNNDRIQDCEKELERSFRDGDLKRAVAWVQRLAYYIKIGEEILRQL